MGEGSNAASPEKRLVAGVASRVAAQGLELSQQGQEGGERLRCSMFREQVMADAAASVAAQGLELSMASTMKWSKGHATTALTALLSCPDPEAVPDPAPASASHTPQQYVSRWPVVQRPPPSPPLPPPPLAAAVLRPWPVRHAPPPAPPGMWSNVRTKAWDHVIHTLPQHSLAVSPRHPAQL